MEQAITESFLQTFPLLDSIADTNQAYLECFRCLDFVKLIERARKFKMGNGEDPNAKADGSRYSSLISGMRNMRSLKKLLVEMVAVGREITAPAPRAIIGSALEKAENAYEWPNFPDGTWGYLFGDSALLLP